MLSAIEEGSNVPDNREGPVHKLGRFDLGMCGMQIFIPFLNLKLKSSVDSKPRASPPAQLYARIIDKRATNVENIQIMDE